MNAAFLDRYCTYHLEDIGMLSPTNLLDFKGYCTEFLEDIKELDRELYRDVMTMSSPKQANLIREIYGVKAKTFEESITEIAEYDPDLAEALNEDIRYIQSLKLNEDETEILEAFDPEKIGSAIGNWFKNAINNIQHFTGIKSMFATLLILFGITMVGANAGAALITAAVLQPLLNMITTIVLIAVLSILIMLPLSFGKNAISIGDIIKAKFSSLVVGLQHQDISKIKASKSRAIALLLRTDMKSCLKSNISENSQLVKDLVIYNLFTRDRGTDPGFSPAQITADNILKCSLSYLTNTIAEMYSSLSTCQMNTRKKVVAPSSFTSLSPELSKLDMAPECQSIRETLDQYVIYFNELLDLAFKSDTSSKQFWKHTLDEHIKAVMGGRHANPVKNASRGVPKRLSKVAFRFEKK